MSYFDDLDAEAARLVGDARDLTQTIAVGEPDPNDTTGQGAEPEAADAQSATPTIFWAPQRRVFFGELGSDAQRLVQQAAQSEPTEAPVESAPSSPKRPAELPFGRRVNGLGPEILRLLNEINAAVDAPRQAAPDPLAVRRSVYAVVAPEVAPSVVYAIGAYFLPKNPVLPVEDYWRQWDNLTKEQADDLLGRLRAANITPRYWNGSQWVTMA